jgi:hypothetical protein
VCSPGGAEEGEPSSSTGGRKHGMAHGGVGYACGGVPRVVRAEVPGVVPPASARPPERQVLQLWRDWPLGQGVPPVETQSGPHHAVVESPESMCV